MAKTITLQDIPEKDLERYYELVQASKWKKEFEDKRKDKYIVDYRLRNLDGSYIKHSTKTFNKDKDAKAFINSLQNEHAIFLYKQEHPENAMTFHELYDEYESSRAFKDKPGTVTASDNLGIISNSSVAWLDILGSKKHAPLQRTLTKHASILLTIIMMEQFK